MTMLGVSDILRDTLWAAPALWIALCVSDYTLTIVCARLYQAQDKLRFQGSFEITPEFQADVNALRKISPRFLLSMVASAALLAGLGFFAARYRAQDFYLVLVGAMVLLQLTVHVRHLRNWHTYSRALGVEGIKGRLEYPRAVALEMSAFELLVFTILYVALFLVTGSLFVLGGAVACAAVASQHRRLAQAEGRPGAAPAAGRT